MFQVVFDETVKGSRSYEAAVKMGFVLLKPSKLHEGHAVIIVSTKRNGNTFNYKVTKAESTFVVVLIQKIMKCPDIEMGIDTPEITKTSTQEAQILGSNLIDAALRNFFRHTSILPLQRQTIISTMAGESILTVSGTGGGKSLMYSLPTVLSSKVTMVISPLKSLIDDTSIGCLNLNISVCKFTGDVPLHIRTEQVKNVDNYRVIFVTPECLEGGEALGGKIDELV